MDETAQPLAEKQACNNNQTEGDIAHLWEDALDFNPELHTLLAKLEKGVQGADPHAKKTRISIANAAGAYNMATDGDFVHMRECLASFETGATHHDNHGHHASVKTAATAVSAAHGAVAVPMAGGNGPGYEGKVSPPKHMWRILEKAVLNKWSGAGCCDVNRAVVACDNFTQHRQVLEFMLQQAREGVISIAGVHQRCANPCPLGWRDITINFAFGETEAGDHHGHGGRTSMMGRMFSRMSMATTRTGQSHRTQATAKTQGTNQTAHTAKSFATAFTKQTQKTQAGEHHDNHVCELVICHKRILAVRHHHDNEMLKRYSAIEFLQQVEGQTGAGQYLARIISQINRVGGVPCPANLQIGGLADDTEGHAFPKFGSPRKSMCVSKTNPSSHPRHRADSDEDDDAPRNSFNRGKSAEEAHHVIFGGQETSQI